MSFLQISLFLALAFASQGLAAGSCDCYKTSAGNVFAKHEFLDFRNGKPDNFDAFFHILSVSDYGPNTVKNEMTPNNVAFKDGTMSLLTNNDGTNLQKSADMYSNPSMLYGSFRMHAQVIGGKGGVAGFFTYLDDYNEQDIEILTDEPENQIHLTNHDNGGVGNGNPTINTTFNGARSDFNTYRMDWTSDKASFQINTDEVQVLNEAIPTKPCTLNVNIWSSGAGWGGSMAVGESATMNVQWIEAVYNPAQAPASSRIRRQESSCANVCKVDGVSKIGVPEPVT